MKKLSEISKLKNNEIGEPKQKRIENKPEAEIKNIPPNKQLNPNEPNQGDFLLKAEANEEIQEWENPLILEKIKISDAEEHELLEQTKRNEKIEAIGDLKKSNQEENEINRPLFDPTDSTEKELEKQNFDSLNAKEKEEILKNPNKISKESPRELRKFVSEINSYFRISVKNDFFENFSVIYDFEKDKFFYWDKNKDYKDEKNKLVFILSNKFLESEENKKLRNLLDHVIKLPDDKSIKTSKTTDSPKNRNKFALPMQL